MKLLKDAYGLNHHEYATAMNNVATLYQESSATTISDTHSDTNSDTNSN